MFYTWQRVEIVLTSPSKPNLEVLDDDVMRLLMGSRDTDRGAPLQAKHILTVIDHVSKSFKQARKRYDGLSEFAHPNYAGMLDIYQRPNNRRQRTVFINSWKENLGRVPLLMAGVLESLTIINFALEQFKDRFPDFVQLCEEEIYRSGTWPTEIPYRWKPR